MTHTSASADRLRTVDLCYIAFFAVLMAIGAWISIPGPVPFTLQTFSVFAALLLLGSRRGALAILVYLLMGAVGLPVFSGFRSGPAVLLGATGGYLLGFLAAALLYHLVTVRFGSRLPALIAACLTGLLACYAFGTAWFLLVYTAQTGPITLAGALSACVLPFLPFDALKIALAILLSRRVSNYLK